MDDQTDWPAHAVFTGINMSLSNGDVEEELARLKQESGKAILAHRGAEFAQSILKLGLIDEYRLIVHPVVLAGGLPLFKEPMDLKLLSTRSFPAGAVALIYGRI
jgi:dihydrofolate reductase